MRLGQGKAHTSIVSSLTVSTNKGITIKGAIRLRKRVVRNAEWLSWNIMSSS